tara:strand:+ start:2878 stop:3861 length:984 start_codon:yes stop_codon:yes gene_type:complete
MRAIKKILVSIIIRTLNEEKYLYELLTEIDKQQSNFFIAETIIVDSGSTDKTLAIAKSFDAKITHIKKKDFSFGRSLNLGCEFAKGDFFVFISGHCIPTSKNWLERLVYPLKDNLCDYTYGKQEARDSTKFSEKQIFSKYFLEHSSIPQKGFFCNNANSALKKVTWKKYLFDEKLTGCEDMELAKRICKGGGKIGYVSEASVFHIHDENWSQIRTRYEREALALQKIIPEVNITKYDVLKFVISGILKDFHAALSERSFVQNIKSIILFRWSQYLGAYTGNNQNYKISKKTKERYFYPITSRDSKDLKDNYFHPFSSDIEINNNFDD